LPHCVKNGTKIISNQGWINPVGAAQKVRQCWTIWGVVTGKLPRSPAPQITDAVRDAGGTILETGADLLTLGDNIISAEAYLGSHSIVEALRGGADIVITGRVADPSLFLAAMIYAFDWPMNDVTRLARGAAIGHLLECGAQLTGGYFADPGVKDIPNLGTLVFRLPRLPTMVPQSSLSSTTLEVFLIVKTVLEQMFYEIHDPASYITPDVIVDFTTAEIEEIGPDVVRVSQVSGKPAQIVTKCRSELRKVSSVKICSSTPVPVPGKRRNWPRSFCASVSRLWT